MTASTIDHTRQLVDRAEITDLVHRLGAALDEGRFDELRALFVGSGSVRTAGGDAHGIDALIAQAARNHRPDERIQHVTTNLLVQVDGDRATVRANLVVHFAPIDGASGSALAPAVQLTIGETYRFGASRTPGGWRLTRVEATPVWMSGEMLRR